MSWIMFAEAVPQDIRAYRADRRWYTWFIATSEVFFHDNIETDMWFSFLKPNLAGLSLQYLHNRIVPRNPNQNKALLFKITLAT